MSMNWPKYCTSEENKKQWYPENVDIVVNGRQGESRGVA